jgi:hypothetical protein
MQENTHTPGPWKRGRALANTGVTPIRAVNGGVVVAHISHPKWGYEDCPQTPGAAEANASLIASAPDLLAALDGIMKWWMETPAFQEGTDEMPADLFDAARFAIAEAKGEAV